MAKYVKFDDWLLKFEDLKINPVSRKFINDEWEITAGKSFKNVVVSLEPFHSFLWKNKNG
jgi:hypothetical protein